MQFLLLARVAQGVSMEQVLPQSPGDLDAL
jgi:hypothetical protein